MQARLRAMASGMQAGGKAVITVLTLNQTKVATRLIVEGCDPATAIRTAFSAPREARKC